VLKYVASGPVIDPTASPSVVEGGPPQRSEKGFSMANEFLGKKIAFLIREEDTDEVGLWEAVRNEWEVVRNAGGTPEWLYTDSGEPESPDHLDEVFRKKRHLRFAKASASDYDGFVLSGRAVNSDFSGMDQDAASFAEQCLQQDGPTLVTFRGKRSM
jgi:hypothetical protein